MLFTNNTRKLPSTRPCQAINLFTRQLLNESEIKAFVAQYPHLSGIDFVEQVLGLF